MGQVTWKRSDRRPKCIGNSLEDEMDTGKKRTEELISNRHRGKRRDKEEEIIKQQESGCR